MKKIIYILLAFLTYFSVKVSAQCDYFYTVTVSTSAYQTDAGYHQVYVFVDDLTGVIVVVNSTGVFTPTFSGLYRIYAVNYLDPNPPVLSAGNLWTNVESYSLSNCMDILGPYTGTAVSICEEICELDDIVVSTSGYHIGGSYQQTYVLVNTSGTILETNTSGTFAGYSIGVYYVYAVNTEETDVLNEMTNLGPWADVSAMMAAYCMDIIGPRAFNLIEAVTPTFNLLGPYCQGDTPGVLPGSSTNSPPITGNWSPATISTASAGTTTYTFTPNAGQCATTTTMAIVINNNVTPTFNLGGTYCEGAVIPALPTSSTNIPTITGTWSPAINNMVSTEYIFTPNAGQCATTTTLTITIENVIIPVFTQLGPYCEGETPNILPSSSNNIPAITGTWLPAVISTGLSGTITYTFTPDGGQCGVTTTMDIVVNPMPDVPTANLIQPTCIANTGSITVTHPTGINYEYSLDGITWQSSVVFNGLNSGTYTVYVHNNSVDPTCVSEDNFVINTIPGLPPLPTATMVQPTCASTTGNITINSPLGANFEYSINGVTWQSSTTFTGLSSGTYTIYVRDNATDPTCVSDDDFVINPIPALPDNPTVTIIQPTCAVPTGSITVISPTGAGMKYSLNGTIWQSSVTFTNLVSGNYIIYVRDNLVDPSCVSNDSYVINTVPSAPSNPIANLTHPTCIILTGSIEITNPLGLNIEYSLDGLTWQSSPLFENLSIGNHTVFVRDNAVDPTCVSNSNFAINNIPDSPTAIISDSHDVTISGNCDGDATVLASGGDGNYTYLWDDSSAQATQTATGLCSGNYTVIVTDGNGCTTSVSITINEPNALVLVLTSNIVTCYAGCDGSTTATVSGGVLPYTYEWGDPLSQNTETAINLCYGMVGITVYDDNGASATGSILVDQNSEIIATTTVISNVSCNGDNDGVASVTAIGGTGLYTYQWDDLALTPTQTVSGLLAGTYNVIIYDANMCVGNAAVVITEPPLFTASAIAEDIMCNGDVTTVSVSGQGGTLSYTGTGTFIVPAGSYNYTITDANACVANTTIVVTEPDSLIVTENISNALCYGLTGSANISVVSGGTGTYSIIWQDSSTNFTNSNILPNTNYGYTVTDANLCTIQGSVSVNQPAEIQTSLSAIDVSCYGNCDGSAAISSITGGSAPYSYIWSNMETTISIVNLCAEVYHLTLTDSNACQAYSSITIEEPDQIQMSISVSDAQCGGIGGTAYATVSGGSGLYNFSWSDTQTGNPVSGLEPGSYIGYVTDTNACTASKNFDIDVSGNIDVEITEIIGIACYGDSNGTLQATSPNGVLPLNYYWDIPANTQIVSDLLAGAYTVSITDGWGCEGYSSYTLVNPVNMVITTDISDVRCYGEANGRITILTINGTPPYTYIWNNEVTDNTITDLAAGTYQVHIIDFNGCEIDESVTVNQPEEILLDYTISNITCSGYQDGAVLLTATGGTIPYNFSINNGINYLAGNSFNNLIAGTYNLLVEDNNDCTDSELIIISEPSAMTGSYFSSNPSCIGNNDGYIGLIVSGGTEPYLYGWNENYMDIPTISGLTQGTYEVIIMDANNCVLNLGATLLEDEDVDCLRIPNAFTPNGDDTNDTWIIENLEIFPGAYVHVFNRWGQKLYRGRPGNEWDGKYNGKFVPTGTYLYIVDLHNGSKPYTGTVSVIY